MELIRKLVLVWAVLLLASCSLFAPPSPEEVLLAESFQALKEEDWESYRKKTITKADFVIKSLGLGPMKARQSYAGSSQRPRERQEQKKQFYRAAQGGEGMIDFKKAEFAGVGTLVGSGSNELITGDTYPYKIYSLKIEMAGETRDTKNLVPTFVIVPWGDTLRLIELLFR